MTTPAEPHRTTDASPRRVRMAVVVNNLTPYRVQSHLRFIREIPGVELETFITWDASRNLWVYREMPGIGVVTFPGAIAESMAGTPDYYIGDFRTGGRVIERLSRRPPDVVVLCGYGFPAMMRVLAWCRRKKVPVILWTDSNVHADRVARWKRPAKNLLLKMVSRSVEAVLVCGENGASYWSRYGVEPERMFYSPVEPDYGMIEHPDPALMEMLVARHGLDRSRRRLIVCSRLVPVKAVDQAIDAFAAVARKRPELDLVILGNGPLRRELEARVPTSVQERVLFAGFQDNQAVVNAWYALSDVLLHPATWEPWGVVLLEAAAAGLAIITTPVVGAVPEVAHDGVNATLFRPNDKRALMAAILSTTRPGVLESMKQASRVVSAHFRRERDPVDGMRRALARVNRLPRA